MKLSLGITITATVCVAQLTRGAPITRLLPAGLVMERATMPAALSAVPRPEVAADDEQRLLARSGLTSTSTELADHLDDTLVEPTRALDMFNFPALSATAEKHGAPSASTQTRPRPTSSNTNQLPRPWSSLFDPNAPNSKRDRVHDGTLSSWSLSLKPEEQPSLKLKAKVDGFSPADSPKASKSSHHHPESPKLSEDHSMFSDSPKLSDAHTRLPENPFDLELDHSTLSSPTSPGTHNPQQSIHLRRYLETMRTRQQWVAQRLATEAMFLQNMGSPEHIGKGAWESNMKQGEVRIAKSQQEHADITRLIEKAQQKLARLQ